MKVKLKALILVILFKLLDIHSSRAHLSLGRWLAEEGHKKCQQKKKTIVKEYQAKLFNKEHETDQQTLISEKKTIKEINIKTKYLSNRKHKNF